VHLILSNGFHIRLCSDSDCVEPAACPGMYWREVHIYSGRQSSEAADVETKRVSQAVTSETRSQLYRT
jgi:hypothetical protein